MCRAAPQRAQGQLSAGGQWQLSAAVTKANRLQATLSHSLSTPFHRISTTLRESYAHALTLSWYNPLESALLYGYRDHRCEWDGAPGGGRVLIPLTRGLN